MSHEELSELIVIENPTEQEDAEEEVEEEEAEEEEEEEEEEQEEQERGDGAGEEQDDGDVSRGGGSREADARRSSPVVGVCWDRNRWRACTREGGKTKYLGRHLTEVGRCRLKPG
jgi:hypothetical protein